MEARGYKYSEEHPDLLVNFFMNTREKHRNPPESGAGFGRLLRLSRRVCTRRWANYDQDRTVNYQVGTINVDIVDAEKKQLIWEGVSEGTVSDEALANPKVTVNGSSPS